MTDRPVTQWEGWPGPPTPGYQPTKDAPKTDDGRPTPPKGGTGQTHAKTQTTVGEQEIERLAAVARESHWLNMHRTRCSPWDELPDSFKSDWRVVIKAILAELENIGA